MVSTRADGWSIYGPWAATRVFLQQGLGNRDLDLIYKRSLDVAPTDDQRWSLRDLQYSLALMRGRSTGLPLPPRYGGTFADTKRVLEAVFSDGDPQLAAPAAAVLERDVGRPVRGGCCLERFAIAEYALEQGRLAVARRALADMRAFRAYPEPTPRTTPWPPAFMC